MTWPRTEVVIISQVNVLFVCFFLFDDDVIIIIIMVDDVIIKLVQVNMC
jgi:hypothetical protein